MPTLVEIALLVVFPALLAYAAASDLFTMTIPNKLTLALMVAFAAFALGSGMGWESLLMHLAAGMLVLVVSFGMFAFGWIGGGDAKLAAVIALWFGFDSLLEYLFVASLAGGALTLAPLVMRSQPVPRFAIGWAWLQRLLEPRGGIPYGIALAGAALAVYPHSAMWASAFRL